VFDLLRKLLKYSRSGSPSFSRGFFYLGELFANTNRREKAIESLKKAEVEFTDMGMDYWKGRTYGVYADLYKKEGDETKAKKNLNEAIEIMKKCSADGWVEKYEKELAAL